jgi:hypothetical protein
MLTGGGVRPEEDSSCGTPIRKETFCSIPQECGTLYMVDIILGKIKTGRKKRKTGLEA